ncbi:MAG: metallophosphoesterase, partial [Deltaproteobacteria bacterium]
KAGILSDSHDQRAPVDAALALFRAEGVGAVLHLGDVCTPGILSGYEELGVPLHGVFGNNDHRRDAFRSESRFDFREGPVILTVSDRKVLMAHSFDELRGELGGSGRFDLVLFGHTHRPMTMRVGRALVLNPGESCGFMRGKPTCAVVDLATMEARIVDIPLPPSG